MFKRFLILFCLVCLPSVAWGQAFNAVGNQSSLYPLVSSGSIVPPANSGLVILEWKTAPSLSVSSTRVVIDANILPSIQLHQGEHKATSTYGYFIPYNEGEYSINYTLIDASNIYVPTATGGILNYTAQIQRILSSKKLGTVAQRQALINTFSIQLPTLIEPSALYNSFLKQLQPFILKFLAVGLILLSVSKGLNYLEKLAAVKHKQREAFRKRGEKLAQAKDDIYKLMTDWTVAAAYRYVENPTRLTRKEFYEQLKEYNDYRASKGWKY